MGIDVNDVKILINGGFHYLIKTCHQWANEHPLVSGVLLFFYLLYIFCPSLFSMLFYTFPLVVCAAILLGKPRISSEKCPQSEIKSFTKTEEKPKTISDNATSSDQRRRPYLTSQMSRRTFGKDKSKTEGISKDNKEAVSSPLPTEDDPVINKFLEEEIFPLKIKEEGFSSSSLNLVLEKIQSSTTSAACSESDSEDNDEPQEKSKKLVEWTEDDQRNLMDLGSSEIERNQRLESLIAKRRAKKLLSMQPRRNPLDYLCSHPSFDHHIDQVGVIARAFDDGDHHHHHHKVGPTYLMKRSRNPFDLPYDPHEEKPVLTGGSFQEDFFGDDVDKDVQQPLCRHGSFNRGGSNSLVEHPLAKSLPSFFLKKPGFTRFKSELDAGEGIAEIPDELSQEGNNPTPKGQDTPREGQLYRTHSAPNDQSPRFPPEEGKLEKSEGEALAQNVELVRSDSISSTEAKKEEETETTDNTAEDNITINSVQLSQRDYTSENKEQDGDNDDEGNSSSSSSSNEIRINATKNEAFRSSVKKVLTCLVRPKSKGLLGKEILGASSSQSVNLPTTKMEERSLYTNKPHHGKTFSIASDMQVEVSETGSPTSGPADPNSPTDRESLVYDADVDKDANSGDEDLWGDSPHPTRLGQLGAKFRLPNIIEESSNNNNNKQEVVDQKSTNGDILEPRSSCSSASSSSPSTTSRTKGLDSQIQGKSEHLAEYLASLPPSGTVSSNTLEEPEAETETELSHVRATSAEVISVQDVSNAIFEVEEDKDDSKQSKELEESRENSEQNTTTSQLDAPNEDINSELLNPAPFITDKKDQYSRTVEDGSKAVVEGNFGVRQPSKEEKSNGKSGKDKTITSGNLDEGEDKTESPSNPIINEKSSSPKNPTTEANQSVNDMNKSEVHEPSNEDKEKMQERVEEVSKRPPSAPGAMYSRQIHNQRDIRGRGAYKHDTSFD